MWFVCPFTVLVTVVSFAKSDDVIQKVKGTSTSGHQLLDSMRHSAAVSSSLVSQNRSEALVTCFAKPLKFGELFNVMKSCVHFVVVQRSRGAIDVPYRACK